MKGAFLEQLASYLIESRKSGLENVMVIMPGRRPFVYLKKFIAEKINSPVWLPEMLTIEDIARKLSGLNPGENVDLLFTLFNAYQKSGSEPLPFSDFLKWGPVALSDFNEIDSHLANREKLYTYLEEARVLEVWNPGADSLTDFQKKYLAFWNALGRIHEEFATACIENGSGYDGLLLRLAAEQEQLPAWLTEKDIVIAGFNAFTPAEEKIIGRLLKSGAEEFFDADQYYLEDESQEAGKFLREHKKLKPEKSFSFVSDHLRKEKTVNITGVAGEVTQGKLAGSIIRDYQRGNDTNIAVVLGDEGLLLPLLNSLPADIPVNVTMGFPLAASPVYRFYKDALDVLRTRTPSGLLHYTSVTTFLSNPVFWMLSPVAEKSARQMIEFIRKKNLLRTSFKSLLNASEEPEFVQRISFLLKAEKEPVNVLIELTRLLIESDRNSDLIRDQLFQLNLILVRLKELLDSQEETLSIQIFSEILDQLVRQSRLAFQGEPLEGIQVMGFLESRLLDFETVVLAGVNEGVVPSGKTAQTFIPWDIRNSFNLFTYHDKDAIFAYHFYRLIQRSKHVHLLYSTSKDETGGGEKSRFIAQMESELAEHIQINHNLLNLSPGQPEHKPAEIVSSPEIAEMVKTFFQRGVSPSSLNTFLSCPLDFFYSYLLRISESSEVEEEVEAASMGTFIHDALENMLLPYRGKAYDFSIQADYNKLSRDAFRKMFSNEDLSTGKNHLALTLASSYLSLLQKTEKAKLDGKPKPVILEVEQKLTHIIQTRHGEILFKGIADRVERTDNTITVIDYKTGNVEASELRFERIEDLFDGSKPKAFQLLFYAWLYSRKHPGHPPLQAAIISFRKLRDYKIMLQYGGNEILDQSLFQDFEEHLVQLMDNIASPEANYTHNTEALYCRFCV